MASVCVGVRFLPVVCHARPCIDPVRCDRGVWVVGVDAERRDVGEHAGGRECGEQFLRRGDKNKMSLPDGFCRHPSTLRDAIVLLVNSCARRYSGPAAAGVEKVRTSTLTKTSIRMASSCQRLRTASSSRLEAQESDVLETLQWLVISSSILFKIRCCRNIYVPSCSWSTEHGSFQW